MTTIRVKLPLLICEQCSTTMGHSMLATLIETVKGAGGHPCRLSQKTPSITYWEAEDR